LFPFRKYFFGKKFIKKKPAISNHFVKVEKILKGSLDSIPSPSPSVKIQIMGGKVCLRCKGKTLLGRKHVNKECKLLNPFFPTVLLSIPFNKLPWFK